MYSLKRSGYREDKAIQQEYSFGYNKWKQVISISAGKYKLAGYEYDTLGRIVKVSDTKGNILAQYSYDAQGQLLMEKLPQQNKRYEYTYDTVGNIQEAKTYTLTGTTATATKKYTYGDASWNDLLTAYDGKEITYDGAGNPLAYNNRTAWKFTWEKGRELSSASADGKNITFTYDVDGIRESKTINGVKHEYVTLDGLIYQEKWGNNTLTFSYDNNDKPYAVKYNTTYYYVLNQQGDVIRIVNENGTTKVEYTYDAWGNVIASTGTDSGIGAVNPLLYRGYYYDSELGMYYLRSRYYDPGVRRFINADSVDYLGENKTELSYNLFAYCENDAVNLVDSDGTFAIEISMAVGAFLITGLSYMGYLLMKKLVKSFVSLANSFIRICGIVIKKALKELEKDIAKSLDKAKKRVKTKRTERHHIIPRKAKATAVARDIWTEKVGLSINNSRNLVDINYNLHRVVHTKVYYDSIETIIKAAYKKSSVKGVLNAVSVLKGFLKTVSSKL